MVVFGSETEFTIMAKAIAGFEGCEWASKLGLFEVWFESDSKELIKSLKGNLKSVEDEISTHLCLGFVSVILISQTVTGHGPVQKQSSGWSSCVADAINVESGSLGMLACPKPWRSSLPSSNVAASARCSRLSGVGLLYFYQFSMYWGHLICVHFYFCGMAHHLLIWVVIYFGLLNWTPKQKPSSPSLWPLVFMCLFVLSVVIMKKNK